MFMIADCIISWKAELQDTVSLSTIEVEYMAIVEASKRALWLRGLIEIFGIMHDSILVHYDGQSVIHLAKNHRYHKQTKHIDMIYHKIRQ